MTLVQRARTVHAHGAVQHPDPTARPAARVAPIGLPIQSLNASSRSSGMDLAKACTRLPTMGSHSKALRGQRRWRGATTAFLDPARLWGWIRTNAVFVWARAGTTSAEAGSRTGYAMQRSSCEATRNVNARSVQTTEDSRSHSFRRHPGPVPRVAPASARRRSWSTAAAGSLMSARRSRDARRRVGAGLGRAREEGSEDRLHSAHRLRVGRHRVGDGVRQEVRHQDRAEQGSVVGRRARQARQRRARCRARALRPRSTACRWASAGRRRTWPC